MAFPIDYKASVVTGLTLIDTWIRNSPSWQSKDLIILFYEDMDYALTVKEFLSKYYHNDSNED